MVLSGPLVALFGQPAGRQPDAGRRPLTAERINAECGAIESSCRDLAPPLDARLKLVELRRRPAQALHDSARYEVKLPLSLQLRGGAGPDVRVQLLQMQWGAPADPTRPQRPVHDFWRRAAASPTTACLHKAAALGLLRLLFPGSGATLLTALAAAGAVGTAQHAASARRSRREPGDAPRPPPQRADVALALPAHGRVCVREVLSSLAACTEAAGAAALALWLCGVVWRTSDPASFSLLQAVAALVPVATGYAHTARLTASGQLAGAELEEAWRLRHKWSAQQVAPLMDELYESPPLAPLADAAERCSVRAGVAVAGQALGEGGGGGWGGGDARLALSFSAGGGPRPATAPAQDAAAAPMAASTSASGSVVAASKRLLPEPDPALSADSGCPGPGVPAPAPSFEAWHAQIGCCEASSSGASSEASSGSGGDAARHGVATVIAQPAGPPSVSDYARLFGAEEGEDSIERVAPLFGQGDHAGSGAPLSAGDRAELTGRALYLLLIFLPFVLLGPLLLLLSRGLLPEEEAVDADLPSGRRGGVVRRQQPGWRRAAAQRARRAAFWLLLQSCRYGGAAFIKWGQWGATREDIFPRDFCETMASLQDKAPTHSFRKARREVERSLRRPLPDMFDEFERRPVASGSIAQVHRARVRGAPVGEWVAVKVRHPHVARRIWLDFQLLNGLAAAAERVPSLRGLGIKETMSQFSHTMTAQADLRVEAAHLQRFFNNFAAVRHSVTQPEPYRATEAVLVESFEPGESVARYMGTRSPLNTDIVAKGVDTYLKMLLKDNFVHTDLHPGNIMVRVRQPSGAGRPPSVQLILLDFGLAEELTPRVRRHFISFLNMIAKGDAVAATSHLLRWSAQQNCSDHAAIEADMAELFRRRCNIHSEAGINLDAVLKDILRLARRHAVSIDSNYAALVIGVCVLVGFATSMHPSVNLMDAAAPCLFANNLTGRVLGRLYG